MGFRYIGSKDKLSATIISEIRNVKPKTKRVIDLMAGTGLFSLALREAGFQVSAVDVMTYSYHHLNVHLLLNSDPKFKGLAHLKKSESRTLFEQQAYEKVINHLNNLTPIKGYFYNEFSPEGIPSNTTRPRKYFSASNAAKIDAIRKEIKKIKRINAINEVEHSLLLHDLIMAANDIANIAGTYGHYLSKFVKRAEDPIILRPSVFSTIGSTKGHRIYRAYAENISSELEGDICYIDPPYMKRQYAANYHILETLAREDEPEAIGESGLRPWRDQYSNFCSKVKIRDAFNQIFVAMKCNDFLISYSEDGLLPIKTLTSFLSSYGSVTYKEIKYKRFKSNGSTKDPILKEFLIHLKKNQPIRLSSTTLK